MKVRGLLLGALLVLLVAAAIPTASSSFPGQNGRIVFVSDRAPSSRPDRDGDIYSVDPSGKRVKVLTANQNFELAPRWSPAGRRIAFSLYGEAYAIHVMRADGSGVRRVTSPRGTNDLSPSWSPSGRRIAFVRQPANSKGWLCGRVLIVNADGTRLKRVTSQCDEFSELEWAPDGRRFAFLRRQWLYVMDPDGTDARRLLASVPLVSGFTWSPDAARIAFTLVGQPGIWVVNADDTNEAPLVPDVRAADLAWSPDGREIAFRTVDFRIAVATIGTGSVRVLGAGGMVRGDSQPDWQPLP